MDKDGRVGGRVEASWKVRAELHAGGLCRTYNFTPVGVTVSSYLESLTGSYLMALLS